MFNKFLISTAITLTALNISNLTQSAYGASFNFSYTLQGGDVVSGMLDGTIESDNDTVIVDDLINSMFNDEVIELPYLDSAIGYFTGNLFAPIVSFSGENIDMIACDSSQCDDGFFFDTFGVTFGVPAYSSGISFGNVSEVYNLGNWSLTEKTTTPESTSILAFVLLGSSLFVKKQVE